MTAVARIDEARTGVRRVAAERVAATNAIAERFFAENADAIADACRAMAGRFEKRGRLFVCGDGAQRSDVAHVVVEFVHPVVVGKRALAAFGLPDVASGAARSMLRTMARHDDLLMLVTAGAPDRRARELLAAARDGGLLTLALAGPVGDVASTVDHLFTVPSDDPCIVQETHEMLYHVLWELVHVFFDHRGATE